MSIENIISLLAVLGIGGILVAILNAHLEQRKQTKEHDIKIFKESNELLNERQLFEISNELLGNHSIVDDRFFFLTSWSHYFEEIGNRYLDKRIEKHRFKFDVELDKLSSFIALHFFEIYGQNPHNRHKYLYPDLHPERGMASGDDVKRYQIYANELEHLTNASSQAYRKYRLITKQALKV